uniref:DNA-directed RNA polymerase n=1 Tax=Oedogonium capilliforme TaxID=2831087 RepID=A0A8E5I516_9CHLO|nr:RNA polymerase beta'' subunit [Oedogonium capilliforme]
MKILFFMIQIKNRNRLNNKNDLIIHQIEKKNTQIIITKTLKKNFKNVKLNYYWNQNFDKNRLKIFIFWCLKNYGQNKTIKVLEILKYLGFKYATKAGLSLSIDDLIIPPTKSKLLIEAELTTRTAMLQYKNAQITNLERFQQIIETWHITSEKMKDDMIYHFKTTNIFNPLYMMAFSGARGNVSQVRQLVGMRGLMANPQGQILDFPIQSNFREGLTLTEYVISCYGARKGVVDTALRTANAGYLTRRLVDVAQHVIISNFDCGTHRGLIISEMKQGNKLLFSLRQRLLGRVLAKDMKSGDLLIATKNQEISDHLSEIIASIVKTVIIRSPLTCKTTQFICQLCYGWSLAEGKLVGVGETVGIIAAQSIGEPGTQLTMRTFHTGGVFAGELLDQLIAPFDGIIKYNIYIPGNMIRTPQGKIAFLTRIESQLIIQSCSNLNNQKYYTIPPYTILFLRNMETVSKNQLIAQLCSFSPSLKNTSDLIEYKIYSDLEGEIKSTNLKILKKVTEMRDIMYQSLEWGYIWILSGKIYQLPFHSIDNLKLQYTFQQKNNFFPIKGDFLTNSSILSQILWINNLENVRLNFKQKNIFYQKFIKNSYNCTCINNSNQIKMKWLKKWQKLSEMSSFINLNKSIKTFKNNLNMDLSKENGLINIYSQNLLLFLTIDKIRYKKFGYFIFFQNNLKNGSLRNLKNSTKQNKEIVLNLNYLKKNSLKHFIFDHKFFIPISLESTDFVNKENSLITSPRFFYQKLSNRFFEWFFNQENQIGSGLIQLSETFIFKNNLQKEILKKNQIRKKQEKNVKLKYHSLTLKKKKGLSNQFYTYNCRNSYSSETRYFQHKSLFLNHFNNEKRNKYLNTNYSLIFFYFRPFIQCEKQQLSQFHYINNKKYFDNLSLLLKPTIIASKKKQIRVNMKNTYRYLNQKIYDFKKQLIKNKLFQKIGKYESNKFFRLISNHMKNYQIIKKTNTHTIERVNLIKFKLVDNSGIDNFNKRKYFINHKKKRSLKTYISFHPLNFFNKIFNHDNFLLKKKFYYKLQLIMLCKNNNDTFNSMCQVRSNSFFTTLSTNYLKKTKFFDKTHKKDFFRKNSDFLSFSFFNKLSNIFISFSNSPTNYIDDTHNCMNSYKYISNEFFYLNWPNIVDKHRILKEYVFKNNFKKSKEIKNLKKLHSSFTYYMIKNQCRFAPSFQKQSINELENIYKKESNHFSDTYNCMIKHKLLSINQLNNNFLSYLTYVKLYELNIYKKSPINTLIKLNLDTYNCMNDKFNIQKFINQIENKKNDLDNQKKWNKNMKNIFYLQILLNQLIKFYNYLFNKKTQKLLFFTNNNYKQKNIEKDILNKNTILNSIYYKKCVPILLIKYKKIEITMNTRSLHPILIFNNFLIRKPSRKKNSIFSNKKILVINNQKTHSLLKMYLIKMHSLNNLVINAYFQSVSFKWLKMQTERSLRKKRIFNPIFLKRLEFAKFINKNLIISHEKMQPTVLDISDKLNSSQQTENNKIKTLNKNYKNNISKIANEILFLYSRFLLIPKEYSKISKKQLSFLFFHPQQHLHCMNPFYKILETRTLFEFCNSNTLSFFHKSVFVTKKKFISNRKLKLKRTLKLLTLKNFLNFKKIDSYNCMCIVSTNNYLQKINTFIFNLFHTLFHTYFQLFKNNRQGNYIPLKFKNCYGIFQFNKKNPKRDFSRFKYIKQEDYPDKNLFHLSEKSSIFLNKNWQLYKNKKEFLLTSQPGWICKPIKKTHTINVDSDFLSNYSLHSITQLLKKNLKLYNQNYINYFKSIPVSYRFCERNLIWFNFTFLKMIELVKIFLKDTYNCMNPLVFLPFFHSFSNFIRYNENFKNIKTYNSKKFNKNCWLINKKSRFLKMQKSNMFFCLKKTTNKIDKIFLFVEGQEFIINNYQNLSYISDTNLLCLSKKKLFKISEKQYKSKTLRNNNGLIWKSQYNSIFLNKQQNSQKLIYKFPNLETTFEQYLGIPFNKILKTFNKENNIKISYDINRKMRTYTYNYINSSNFTSNHIQQYSEINQILTNSNSFNLINKNYKIFKSQKSLNTFRHFLGFSIPITFDFSFQSSHIFWNYFPNYNLSNLKLDKKKKSMEFFNYLILKNKLLNFNIFKLKKSRHVLLHEDSMNFINIFNSISMLLRQPCINWSTTKKINLGYQKNIFLAPTKTFLLLSLENSSVTNNPIALTKIFSNMKGEILYSLKNKKNHPPFHYPLKSGYKNKFEFNEFLQKYDRSIFLTKSDQICLKFKNEIYLNNELAFFKKFNVFKNQKHIRGLKTFQIKSSKQIFLIFKILQKIHNNCQFSNQSIKINLGLFLFQGDLLNTFFRNSNINNNTFNCVSIIKNKKTTKIQKNYTRSIVCVVNNSGQIIHLNQQKLTLRKGQPIFFSPHCIFHSYNSDFIEQNKPVLSLPYQQLKTGDIVQGIPKIEQLFEARLTFAGKLEYDNLTNILEIIFQTYKNKLTLKLAVRRSIELVQMIIVNSIQRIYRSQGVNISDKHLEVIVKQMTKKVEIIDSGQSGFLIGEHFDLDVVELWNSKLSKIKHVKYKPLILGISKASLQTDSFLSAASFQYTTRILSQSAFFKKRDFLKGLKENIIVGNIIPAGTGYLGHIEDLFETS